MFQDGPVRTRDISFIASYSCRRTAHLRNDENDIAKAPVRTPTPDLGLVLPQASTREEAARWVEVLKVLQTMEEEESKVSSTDCPFRPVRLVSVVLLGHLSAMLVY